MFFVFAFSLPFSLLFQCFLRCLQALPPCFAAALSISVFDAGRLPVTLTVVLTTFLDSVLTLGLFTKTEDNAFLITSFGFEALFEINSTFDFELVFFSAKDLNFGASFAPFVTDLDLV